LRGTETGRNHAVEAASSVGSKRMLNLWILDILRRHSGKTNPLTHEKIIEHLKMEYDLDCRRSTVGTYIHDFGDERFQQVFGYSVHCDKRGAGYYLKGEFSDAELRMLIDSVLASRGLPIRTAKDLVKKLIRHGSLEFQKIANSYTGADLQWLPRSSNERVMDNIVAIQEAIQNGHQLSFVYNNYALNKSNRIIMKPRRSERYTVNPYRLAIYGCRIYLVCNTKSHDNISYYRVDKMTQIAEEVTPCEPWRNFDKAYNPPKTLTESLHMFSDEASNIEFWIEEACLGDLLDWFGQGYFKIYERRNGMLRVGVHCSLKAMKFWVMSYGEYVEVIKPNSLRQEIWETAKLVMEQHTDV